MFFETWLKSDLKKPVAVERLPCTLFYDDDTANQIVVEITDDGEPAELDGLVRCIITGADGKTSTTWNGYIFENKVYCTLTSLAYNVPGQVKIVIKVDETTVAACIGYVYESKTSQLLNEQGQGEEPIEEPIEIPIEEEVLL